MRFKFHFNDPTEFHASNILCEQLSTFRFYVNKKKMTDLLYLCSCHIFSIKFVETVGRFHLFHLAKSWNSNKKSLCNATDSKWVYVSNHTSIGVNLSVNGVRNIPDMWKKKCLVIYFNIVRLSLSVFFFSASPHLFNF